MNPIALIQTIKINLLRRPLWQLGTVQDCLDLSREQVIEKIECGEFPWAFDIGTGSTRREPRILAACVLERVMGPVSGIGATKNLGLPEVINLVLPQRDIRSTELTRLLSCAQQHVHHIAYKFKVAAKPRSTSGPNSYSVFARQSVARFLEQRRIA